MEDVQQDGDDHLDAGQDQESEKEWEGIDRISDSRLSSQGTAQPEVMQQSNGIQLYLCWSLFSFWNGILKTETEKDLERQYTPINSQAAQDRDKMKASFPDWTGTNYNTYSLNTEDRYGVIIAISDRNIFSNTSIGEMRNLVDTIKQFLQWNFKARLSTIQMYVHGHQTCVSLAVTSSYKMTSCPHLRKGASPTRYRMTSRSPSLWQV
ncbi:uncharacterized protein LOC124281753 [Haliotis rubra]|uniref:uncharacterized protein LOC124281753 n=1 Tax=Haliotis rubra TaxID=36100 RepID=UPI001EE61943|nr:uncharacterized protein LOC124281753 [Haliotis rubra]